MVSLLTTIIPFFAVVTLPICIFFVFGIAAMLFATDKAENIDVTFIF